MPSGMFKKNEKGKALLILGPSGCGKRALVHAIANEMGLQVEEPADVDSIQSLLRVTQEGIRLRGLCAEPKLWLFTGLDGFLSEEGLTAVKKLVDIWTSSAQLPPIVFTLHAFPDTPVMRVVRQTTALPRVYLYPIKPGPAEQVLNDIGERERVSLQDVLKVKQSFSGDLRQAIISLSMKRPSSVTCKRTTSGVKLSISPCSNAESTVRGLCLHLYVRARNDSNVEYSKVQEAFVTDTMVVFIFGFTEYDIMKAIKNLQKEFQLECMSKLSDAMDFYEEFRQSGYSTFPYASFRSILRGLHASDIDAAEALVKRHFDTGADESCIRSDVKTFLSTMEPKLYVVSTLSGTDHAIHYQVRRSRPLSASSSTKDLFCSTPFDVLYELFDTRRSFTDTELEELFVSHPMAQSLAWNNMYMGMGSAPLDKLVDILDAWGALDCEKWNMCSAESYGAAVVRLLKQIRQERASSRASRPAFGSLKCSNVHTGRSDVNGSLKQLKSESVEYALMSRVELADRLPLLRERVKAETVDALDGKGYTCTDMTRAHVDPLYVALGVKSNTVTSIKPLPAECILEDDNDIFGLAAMTARCMQISKDDRFAKEFQETVALLDALGADTSVFKV